jgi:serine/threonine protein kinase/tetratricopeptide (TPR) repeat protein
MPGADESPDATGPRRSQERVAPDRKRGLAHREGTRPDPRVCPELLPVPPTPTIPVPPLRRSHVVSLVDTPAPTVRFVISPPLTPPQRVPAPVGSAASGGSGFDGESVAAGPTMPDVGDEFQGFRLVEELGRGTFGRVFLAHQAALAGRPVALKVTLRPSREPERLARLQHTNVVPVYSVHAAGPIQLICMPFLGRRTLADVLRSHRTSTRSANGWSRKTRAQRGSTTVTTGSPRPATELRPTSPVPTGLPPTLVRDADSVLRVLSQLAAGLAHAHGRGILHLDIKPGNVLLADTGEPMLLDFNLSIDAAEADRDLVGGTVPYMAPEQLLDMRSRGRGEVDARTDLYALGVVAYELLTGEIPFPGTTRTLAEFDRLMAARREGPPPLREQNPFVTPAVESIVRKLLAPDPSARYQSALDLKDDVDRQIADRPLRYARDRSVVERVRKWRRRNPRFLVASAVVGVVLAATSAGAAAVHATHGRSAAEARLKARDALDGMHSLRIDLTAPDEPLYGARGVARSRELLADYGLPDDPNWRERDAFRHLPQDTQSSLAGDLGELLVLLGSTRLAAARDSAGPETEAPRDEAVRCAHAAADCFAGSEYPPALASLKHDLGLAPDRPARANTARDHFLDAARLVLSGRYADAIPVLEEATLLDPGHAAAHYLLGQSLGHLGRSERAAERHAVAAGLMRTDRRVFRQWGSSELSAGQPDRAVRILDRASVSPSGPTAELRYLTGIARLRLGRFDDARTDLSVAVASGVRPVSALLARSEVLDRSGDPAGARADRAAAYAAAPASSIELTERGKAREAADPDAASVDYRQAIGANGAAVPEAYRGLIRLALDRGNNPLEALAVADAATSRFRDTPDFHAARAVALARLNRVDQARSAAEASARMNPSAEATFRIAAAYAQLPEAADRTAALAWLRRAYLAGVRNADRLDASPDLGALRGSDEYKAFRAAVEEMNR